MARSARRLGFAGMKRHKWRYHLIPSVNHRSKKEIITYLTLINRGQIISPLRVEEVIIKGFAHAHALRAPGIHSVPCRRKDFAVARLRYGLAHDLAYAPGAGRWPCLADLAHGRAHARMRVCVPVGAHRAKRPYGRPQAQIRATGAQGAVQGPFAHILVEDYPKGRKAPQRAALQLSRHAALKARRS